MLEDMPGRQAIIVDMENWTTYVMGADYFDLETTLRNIPLGIGKDCYVEGAILDKNVRLGEGVVIKPFPDSRDLDRDTWFVRDGIVVIPKNTEIPPGTQITPEK